MTKERSKHPLLICLCVCVFVLNLAITVSYILKCYTCTMGILSPIKISGLPHFIGDIYMASIRFGGSLAVYELMTHLSFLKAHALTFVLEERLDLRHVDLGHHLLLHFLHLDLLLLIVHLRKIIWDHFTMPNLGGELKQLCCRG